MAFNKKYAGLPDLDLAPDIYETPELSHDVSTLPTARSARSASPSSSTSSRSASSSRGIDRQRIDQDQARTQFLPARVDARDVNFSDSLASKKKSYRTSTRRSRRRQRDDGTQELGDFSDSEDESLERKLARLRRETEELKVDLEKRKAERTTDETTEEPAGQNDGIESGLLELNQALDTLKFSARGQSAGFSSEAILAKRLAAGPWSNATKIDGQPDAQQSGDGSSTPSGLLANAASFDARLVLLETALGVSDVPVSLSPDNEAETQPILPTLNHLTSQLATLSSTLTGPSPGNPGSGAAAAPEAPPIATTPYLEALTTRIRKLTADADALSSARRRATEAARTAQLVRLAAIAEGLDTPEHHASTNDAASAAADRADEQVAKIQALYATLPTITSLHPLLPSVLERLRSLRAIHAGASRASEDLDALERKQAEMKKEIETWREGLGVVEERMKEGEAAMKGNMDLLGPWVKDLEKRMEQLG